MTPDTNRTVILENWQTLSLQTTSLEIVCKSGAVWVTWPKGQETVIESGHQVRIDAAGKICIQALAGSVVSLRAAPQRKWSPTAGLQHKPLALQAPAW